MDYKQLYDKAMLIQNEAENRIYKDIKEYAFTFVYPPPQALHNINYCNLPDQNERDINKPVNVYLHIPFCTGKCKYCYFCAYELSNSPVKKFEYVNCLCKEIELINRRYGKLNIRSIHFGGGTPTVLTDEEFELIFEVMYNNMNISTGIEITCESSPETLTSDKVKFLFGLGVNRLNIGIQTLNDSLLKSINRRHNSKQALDAIDIAHNNGFTNINVDLMYGLPGQTFELWKDNLKQITRLGLQSISTYRLRIHPNGRLANDKNLHQEYELIRMYVELLQIMDEAGYMQSSSHKFTLEREFVQKQIISKRGIKDNELVPIGMSSYGYMGNMLYWNCRDINSYRQKLANSELPCALGYELDKREQMSKVCVLGIHNLDGINITVFEQFFGIKFGAIFNQLVDYLKSRELIIISDGKLKLTKLGMIFADEIAIQFYSENIKDNLNKKGLRYGIFFDEIL
jgi:oxygen-independent coproporphyrinogen III oxidase